MRNTKSINWTKLIILIISLGLFLRLWRFKTLFYFAIDEEKAGYIIQGIISGSHFPSVGHPSSIGFRLGPILYYLLAPFYKIFGPSPLTWGYLSILSSFFSMILIYQIGSKINKSTGLFSLLLFSFSYLNVLYDRRGWQLSFHSLIALGIIFFLLQIKKGEKRAFFPLTFLLIAASQFEVATLLFLPLVFLSWFFLRLKISQKIFLLCGLTFLLSHLGLLFFDFRHHFLNTRYLINYFRPASQERVKANLPLKGKRTAYLAHRLIPSTFARTIFVFSEPNMALQYANCPEYLYLKQTKIPFPFKLFIIGIFLYFFYFIFRNWKKQDEKTAILKIIFLYFFLLTFGISFYTYLFQGEMAEYYLLSAFAYFFIIFGFLLSQIKKVKNGLICIILFLTIFTADNLPKIFTSYNPYGLKNKEEAVKYSLSIIGKEPFILESFQTCWYSGGYRYLYTLSGHEPLKSYMDQYLSEYYSPKNHLAKYKVSILTPEFVGENPAGFESFRKEIKSKSQNQKKFDLIEVYIQKLTP